MSKKALRQASEHNGPAADQKRNKLDWLELHITSSKKSPEQHPSLWANRSTRFNSYFAVGSDAGAGAAGAGSVGDGGINGRGSNEGFRVVGGNSPGSPPPFPPHPANSPRRV